MARERGFMVRGESLQDPDVVETVMKDLGELAAIHNLQVDPVGFRIITEDDIWERNPAGLTREDFNRLVTSPTDIPMKGTITRAWRAALREARRYQRTNKTETGEDAIPAEFIQKIVDDANKYGKYPISAGEASLAMMQSVLDHTRPAEPRT